MDSWNKMQRIDPRLIYLLILLAMVIPMFKPMGLPVAVSPETKTVFEAIDSLPSNAVIFISHDTGPGNAPELDPMIAALARQAFKKNIKLVVMSLWEMGAQFADDQIKPIAAAMGKTYGVDYVNLGYKIGGSMTIRTMVNDLSKGAAGVDMDNKPLDSFPLMQRVKSLKDVDLLFVTTVGSPGYSDWMTYAAEPLKKKLTGGASLTMYSGLQQYIRSGQLTGYLGGMRGAAEYERLVGAPGKGLAGMDSQSLGHILVILLIILGNIGYFRSLRATGPAGGK